MDLIACVKAIRKDAEYWKEEAQVPRDVVRAATGLRMDLLEALLFGVVIDANNQAADFVHDRCSAGLNAMLDVSDALYRNATAYEEHETDLTEHVQRAY